MERLLIALLRCLLLRAWALHLLDLSQCLNLVIVCFLSGLLKLFFEVLDKGLVKGLGQSFELSENLVALPNSLRETIFAKHEV